MIDISVFLPYLNVRANFELLKRLMDFEGIETLLVYGSRNVGYLSGIIGIESWIHGSFDLAPAMICLNFSGNSFGLLCNWSHEDIPFEILTCDAAPDAVIMQAAEELKARGMDQGVIGVDKLAMPAYALEILEKELPKAMIVSADSILLRTRAQKTPSEISLMQQNVDIAEAAWEDVKSSINIIDGMDFHEITLAWSQAVIGRGSFPVYIAPNDLMYYRKNQPRLDGQGNGAHRWPMVVEAGVVYRLDLCTVHQGYFSDQKYNFCLGEPRKDGLSVYREDCERQEFMAGFIKPGITKRELHEACCREFRELEANPYYCHGIGMDLHEQPRVGTRYAFDAEVWGEVTFENNAVIALEPSWLVEDMFVLETAGMRRMGQRDKLEIF